MSAGNGGRSVEDARLKPFLASSIFVVPWISWQAWVLGVTFRQRRGKLVADKVGGASTETSAPAPGAPSPSQRRWRPVIFVMGATLLFLAAQAWLRGVLVYVPEPYLDEVFHIPQAQRYCQGRWLEWDDKITTPPGLYLFSVLYQGLWKAVDGSSVWALRGANNIAIMLVAMAACSCRSELEHQEQQRLEMARKRTMATTASHKLADSMFSLYAFHSALNIALFPVLFFFSALYYTDVYSTLVTLVAYRVHLFRRQFATVAEPAAPPLWSGLLAVLLGLATLLMRQTNVFWVVVYMGGLEAIQAIKSLRLRPQAPQPLLDDAVFASPLAMASHYAQRYALGDIHDPPLGESWPDDWILTLVSVAIAILCNPIRILRHVWPSVLVLGLFAGFVAWNGGVVLGDKSNHVVTLHLAQLLYIWPLVAFFSAPLFVSHAAACIRHAWALVTGTAQEADKDDSRDGLVAAAAASAAQTGSPAMRLLSVVFVRKAYYPAYLLAVLAAMLAIVRYNTIVHPFTLADNRHYMFYVFRYTIRRADWFRYALVPVYAATSWACWRVLWGCSASGRPGGAGNECSANSPFSRPTPRSVEPAPPREDSREDEKAAPLAAKTIKQKQAADRKAQQASQKAAAKRADAGDSIAAIDLDEQHPVFVSLLDEEPAASAAMTPPATSTALLWLLASALSLVTAPLVEPRYFILPWVFWRLLVPAVPIVASPKTAGFLASLGRKVDGRLALETLWFLAINVVTMYIFLSRPYVWRAEDGSLLDQGRLQRFMW